MSQADGIDFFVGFYVGDVLLCVTLTGFWAYHMWLIVVNSTTVEQQARFPTVKYNVGWYRNMKQVFGRKVWFWPWPVWGQGPDGNGLEWPTDSGHVVGRIPSSYGDPARGIDAAAAATAGSHGGQAGVGEV